VSSKSSDQSIYTLRQRIPSRPAVEQCAPSYLRFDVPRQQPAAALTLRPSLLIARLFRKGAVN
jgi:hypothetical protein